MRKLLGILGGLGPMASARFFKALTEMTDAGCDQQHLETILRSAPGVPDRTAFLQGNGQDPVPELIRLGNALARQGAELLAIPCMTCHCFYDRLAAEIPIPILNAVEETADYLASRGIRTAGLLATGGTVKAGIFHRALAAKGIETVIPGNQELVEQLIYGCLKAGKKPNPYLYYALRDDLHRQGAEVTILGCTELPLLADFFPLGRGVLDSSRVLAQQAITQCGGKVRAEFAELIT